MQQTLLALVAILIFSYFALSQHGARADIDQFAISAEVEFAAGRLARQRLATVLARAFDEADVGVSRVRTSPAGLSTIGPDDGVASEVNDTQYDDVDDYDGLSQPVTADWMDQEIAFTDSVSVRYVDPATLVPVPGPSMAKEITVVVRAAPAGFVGTPQIAATLQQIVTPTSN